MAKPTLQDIAAAVGVSFSTVSRVLSGDKSLNVPESTRERVWQAARDAGYLQHRTTRTRKEQHRRSVGVIVAPHVDLHHSPYYSSLVSAVQSALAHLGVQIRFVLTHRDVADPSVLYTQISPKHVDGLIVLGTPSDSLLAWSDEQAIGVVLLSSNSYQDDMRDRVAVDHVRSSTKAVVHLAGLGCRRIAYVGATGDTLRYKGYLAGLAECNVPPAPELVWSCSWDVAGACSVMHAQFGAGRDAAPDGIFAGSDELALGVIRTAQEHGLRVPHDLRVVGHDDHPLLAYTSPALTTVHVPLPEMADTAARLLLDRLEGRRAYPIHVFMPTHVVVRESCGARAVSADVMPAGAMGRA